MKIVFKPKRSERKLKDATLAKVVEESKDSSDFREIISNIISSKKDPYLVEVYEFIINDNKIKADDIMIL